MKRKPGKIVTRLFFCFFLFFIFFIFYISQPIQISLKNDNGSLLIDDVFTTGTTLNECSRTLKNAGAAKVHALTVSRALPDWKPDYKAL